MSGPGRPVHAAELKPDTAYTMTGPRTGHLWDARFTRSYPAEGICSCGEMIRCEERGGEWKHTGRMPGEDAPPGKDGSHG